MRVPRAASPAAVENGSSSNSNTVPTPKVIIDQDSDPDATIVEVTLGDRLGDLLDTVCCLHCLFNLPLPFITLRFLFSPSWIHEMLINSVFCSMCR